jgi:hypothetical protein
MSSLNKEKTKNSKVTTEPAQAVEQVNEINIIEIYDDNF